MIGRAFRITVVAGAALGAALIVALRVGADRAGLRVRWRSLAAEAAESVRLATSRGESAEAALARFGERTGHSARLICGAGGTPCAEPPHSSRLDSMRLDEAPRALAHGAVAPLKDADGWDVVGIVEVLGGPDELSPPSPLRPREVVSIALLAAFAAWLVRWSLRTGERRRREVVTAWSFLAAPFAHLLVFSILPVAFTLYLSFHSWDLLAPRKPFVGFTNYRAIADDELFRTTLRNTTLYVLYVPVTMAAALGLALVLERARAGVSVLRALVLLPFVTSTVAIAIVWQWMFNADFGLVNAALAPLGIGPVDWLGRPGWALLSIIAVTVWTQVGYQMVVFLAGLKNIPPTYYEAALVDGASSWQRFRHVTLPLLRPVILFVLVTGVIGGFQVFTLVYVMTEGGPLHSTDVIVYRIYQTAWEFLRFGEASAMAVVLLLILLALTAVQFRLLGRRQVYP
jgi:multiple sugar transport system permease protein